VLPPEPVLPGPLLLEHAASDISPIASTPLKTVRAEIISSSGKRLLSRTVGQSFFETDGHSRTQASVLAIGWRKPVECVAGKLAVTRDRRATSDPHDFLGAGLRRAF
jgi:hypothetical protein